MDSRDVYELEQERKDQLQTTTTHTNRYPTIEMIVDCRYSYLVLYDDNVFPNLSTILLRYNNPIINERRINTRLANVRQNIEHIFGLDRNIFKLFRYPERFQLLYQGKKIYM